MPRTNISIADDVADGLSDEAMKRNKTLYAFANESLGAVISVCRLAGEPGEMLPSWKMCRMLRDVEAVPIPGPLLEKMVKRLMEADREWTLKAWYSEGHRIGSYLRMGYQDVRSLSQAAVEFQGLLPLRRLEFRSVEQEDAKGVLVIRAIGAGLSGEATECAEHLMRGVVEAYEWKLRSCRTAEGIIEMRVSSDR